jgi:hypothetical protein
MATGVPILEVPANLAGYLSVAAFGIAILAALLTPVLARLDRLAPWKGPLRLVRGEVAVVPLSLAGDGPVSSLDVPPLTVRALGVRASARASAARAFLDFLTGEKGNAAFRACGRAGGP